MCQKVRLYSNYSDLLAFLTNNTQHRRIDTSMSHNLRSVWFKQFISKENGLGKAKMRHKPYPKQILRSTYPM